MKLVTFHVCVNCDWQRTWNYQYMYENTVEYHLSILQLLRHTCTCTCTCILYFVFCVGMFVLYGCIYMLFVGSGFPSFLLFLYKHLSYVVCYTHVFSCTVLFFCDAMPPFWWLRTDNFSCTSLKISKNQKEHTMYIQYMYMYTCICMYMRHSTLIFDMQKAKGKEGRHDCAKCHAVACAVNHTYNLYTGILHCDG